MAQRNAGFSIMAIVQCFLWLLFRSGCRGLSQGDCCQVLLGFATFSRVAGRRSWDLSARIISLLFT